ncbi:MAG: glycosyltransferase family 9 protein [Gemmatimonadota bacterium]
MKTNSTAGPASRTPREAPDFSRILIVKLSALGDVAHALPAVDYLRRAAPGAEIDWVVDSRFADVVRGNPALRRVVPLDLGRWKTAWWTRESRRHAARAARELRAGGYDAAFDIQGNLKSGVVTLLSGAPVRIGFGADGVREPANLLFTNRKAALLPGDAHIAAKILRVVSAPFGGAFDLAGLRGVVATSAGDDAAAASLLRQLLPGAAPILALHGGTTWVTKRMDPPFWAAAIRALRARFPALGVLLSWGTEDERRDAELARALAGGAVALAPRVSLKVLAALYRECGFLMAPDTGPLHVAAAAGARTVSVFRATDGKRNAPLGPGHRFLQAPLPCTACLKKRCARDRECRESLPADAAAEAMAELMGAGAAAP